MFSVYVFTCRALVNNILHYLCQERDERRKRLKKERAEERAINMSQQAEQFYQTKHFKSYDKSRLPSGISSV